MTIQLGLIHIKIIYIKNMRLSDQLNAQELKCRTCQWIRCLYGICTISPQSMDCVQMKCNICLSWQCLDNKDSPIHFNLVFLNCAFSAQSLSHPLVLCYQSSQWLKAPPGKQWPTTSSHENEPGSVRRQSHEATCVTDFSEILPITEAAGVSSSPGWRQGQHESWLVQ